MKSHYESLEIDPSATKEEIKKAYRKLCMETHPDVASTSKQSSYAKNANVEKFRQISEAHRILSDDVKRRRYDYELSEARRFGRPLHHQQQPFGGAGFGGEWQHHGRRPRSSSFSFGMAMLDGIYKPRNLFLGLTLGFLSVSLLKSQLQSPEDPRKRTGVSNTVEAWKNPTTGRWEQPAPWDPLLAQ